LTSHDAAGSSPNAKNNAAPINTSTDDIEPSRRTAPYVTATPADAVNPTPNGVLQFIRGPRGPNGGLSERIRAARCSASAIGPSASL
jgi:hypothetical protein